VNDLQEKLENIAAFKLHFTQGMCRQEYKREQDAVLAQLARMEMVYGAEFIVEDFTTWCGSEEAKQEAHPFDVYFRNFDSRMRGMPYPVFGRPENPKMQEATAWLQDALQDESKSARRIFQDALNGAGIKADTLRQAAKALGIKPQRIADGWLWALPRLNVTAATVSQDPDAKEPVAVSYVPEKITVNASASESEQAEAIRRILGAKP
jgi:hypothetical protein